MTPNAVIAAALATNAKFVRRYTDDLKPADFDHQPLPGVNSAAWLFGHLILTERRVLEVLGATDLPPLTAGFAERFATTKAPAGEQGHFADGPELLALFHDHRARLIAAVEAASAEQLAAPVDRPSPMYATAGEFAHFMPQHVAMHVGQVTVIRRSLGYPPVS